MGAKSPARAAGDHLLSDGAWHSRSELVEAMSRAVPPAVANRRYVSVRDIRRKAHGVADGAAAPPVEARVRSGALAEANHKLQTAVRIGAWERREDGWLRLAR